MDVNKRIWRHFEKMLNGHQYGYQMKGLASKNVLVAFQFSCLFTFRKLKQRFVYILKNRYKVIIMGTSCGTALRKEEPQNV
jgi:hypothetical protein